MPRKILHLDLDAFFCAVEELHDPSLKGTPFAVGGQADRRGVVASCSYAARLYGVRSAMPMARAKQLCPELIVVSSRHGNYSQVSKQVMALIDITPFIEKISIDEAFMEVTDLPEPLPAIARDLQGRVNREMKLPISIGGGTNKLVAKIANDWGKSQKHSPDPPNAITIIPLGEEAAFLSPLPVQSLWGVGPKTAAKLETIGIKTIGKLAQTPPATLEMMFGQYGPDLRRRALGIDNRPIETEHDVKSISNEVTFATDLLDEEHLLSAFRDLSEQVGRRLRKASLAGNTVRIKLRWTDFTTITRQTTATAIVLLMDLMPEKSDKAVSRYYVKYGSPLLYVEVVYCALDSHVKYSIGTGLNQVYGTKSMIPMEHSTRSPIAHGATTPSIRVPLPLMDPTACTPSSTAPLTFWGTWNDSENNEPSLITL